MDVIVICNGLGNQMSQYALYLSKKAINKQTRFILDKKSRNDHNGFELDRLFGINFNEGVTDKLLYFIFRLLGIKKYPQVSHLLIKFLNVLGFRLINENYNYKFQANLLVPAKGINFYYGGWHSENYFISVKEQVRQTFQFIIKDESEEFKFIVDKIKKTNSVAVHVRRGDFLNGINYTMFGAVCTESYFENAIKQMELLSKNPYFFVFTNDVVWASERFNGTNFEIVTLNQGINSWKDMYLISLCKNNINSNSSFSWWGAWLNSNPDKKVIVPHFFINNVKDEDVYPTNWIKLSDY